LGNLKLDLNLTNHLYISGGLNIPGEDESYDFGSGAGFYLNATKAPYSSAYKMYSYITSELSSALTSQFTELDSSRMSIMGHSMGGHGALILYLKNPGMYRSCSAFAPIANPSNCDWGKKAFGGYLESKGEWAEYDATELVRKRKEKLDVLIDVVCCANIVCRPRMLMKSLGYRRRLLQARPAPPRELCRRGKRSGIG